MSAVDPIAGVKPARNRNPNGQRRHVYSRQAAIRRVLLEWLEEWAPDVPVSQVDELAREVSRAVPGSVVGPLRSSWRLKGGATADDARRLAAQLEASWPGGERR